VIPPSGLSGGGNGLTGRNAIRRHDGNVDELPGRTQFKCQPGDAVIIQTPSGGGYGVADSNHCNSGAINER